jgi:DNA transformation protein and related proteins
VTVSSDYLSYVLEQLAGLGELSCRRMFGGTGLYCGEFFFGLVMADVLYLRVNDASRGDYTARGMAAFRPYADRSQLSMNYFEVPAEVLENSRELTRWAQRAVTTAQSAPARAPRRRRRAHHAARVR